MQPDLFTAIYLQQTRARWPTSLGNHNRQLIDLRVIYSVGSNVLLFGSPRPGVLFVLSMLETSSQSLSTLLLDLSLISPSYELPEFVELTSKRSTQLVFE